MRGMQRNAGFGGQAEGDAFEADRRIERLRQDALDRLGCLRAVAQSVEQQTECIGADACGRLGAGRGSAQAFGNGAQCFVPGRRTMGVVDRTKPIEIEQHDAEFRAAACRAAGVHRDTLQKAHAIRQSRERIVVRQVFGLFRFVDERHPERDVGGELFQQLDFVRREETGTRRIKNECADRFAV